MRFYSELNLGFGHAIIDRENNDRALAFIDEGFIHAGEIADAIVEGLNQTDPQLNLEHEDD